MGFLFWCYWQNCRAAFHHNIDQLMCLVLSGPDQTRETRKLLLIDNYRDPNFSVIFQPFVIFRLGNNCINKLKNVMTQFLFIWNIFFSLFLWVIFFWNAVWGCFRGFKTKFLCWPTSFQAQVLKYQKDKKKNLVMWSGKIFLLLLNFFLKVLSP